MLEEFLTKIRIKNTCTDTYIHTDTSIYQFLMPILPIKHMCIKNLYKWYKILFHVYYIHMFCIEIVYQKIVITISRNFGPEKFSELK